MGQNMSDENCQKRVLSGCYPFTKWSRLGESICSAGVQTLAI